MMTAYWYATFFKHCEHDTAVDHGEYSACQVYTGGDIARNRESDMIEVKLHKNIQLVTIRDEH